MPKEADISLYRTAAKGLNVPNMVGSVRLLNRRNTKTTNLWWTLLRKK
jgi:hypothetical protein